MEQLIHHGVYIPEYKSIGLTLKYKGRALELNPETEQMAVAFVKKFGTAYVKDTIFVSNFLEDFTKKLGIPNGANIEDFDWTDILNYIEDEKKKKEKLTREERRRFSEERKKYREALKEKYGYAIVDGTKVVLQNWVVEPPGIFISKGKNPLRGKWKSAVKREDITLNLSEKPEGLEEGWKEVVWKSNCMWIACWRNPLNGKMKYIWFSPNSKMRQDKEIKKWEKAQELRRKIKEVGRHVKENLTSKDIDRRKVATAVYLIKESGIRVGDERIAGEMGTIGCTTLKSENVKIEGQKVILDFVGKDYVQWHRELILPGIVLKNLKMFKEQAQNGSIFNGINSQKVSRFLQEVTPGVSAKTFRTMIAGETLKESIKDTNKLFGKDEFQGIIRFKYINCAVAKRLNHKKKLPDKFEEKLRKRQEKMEKRRAEYEELKKKLVDRKEAGKQLLKKLEKAEKLYQKAKLEFEVYRDTSEWNLSTSLNSYIDPRLVVEYARRNHIDINLLYSKSLREKFSWALG